MKWSCGMLASDELRVNEANYTTELPVAAVGKNCFAIAKFWAARVAFSGWRSPLRLALYPAGRSFVLEQTVLPVTITREPRLIK
jgi:hypothetical protein